MASNINQKIFHFCLIAFGIQQLGSCSRPPEGDKGGDHVPEGEVYLVDKLPKSAGGVAIATQPTSSRYFQTVVRPSESYLICFNPESFTAIQVNKIDLALTSRGTNLNSSGLSIVLNHAMENISKWEARRSATSSRIEFTFARLESSDCQLSVMSAKPTEFPFTMSPFAEKKWVNLNERQLKDPNDQLNSIPIVYLRESLSDSELLTATTRSVANFIGLGTSGSKNSILNEEAGDLYTSLGFRLENDQGSMIFTDDTAIIYGFAGIYQDILKPQDLGAAQHFADRVMPGEPSIDPDLSFNFDFRELTFFDVFDSAYLRGTRVIDSQISVCFQNFSSQDFSEAWLDQYLDFGNWGFEPRSNSGIFFQLNKLHAAFKASLVRTNTNCNLVVVLKTSNHYPFKHQPVAGLYAHEGTLRDKDGKSNKIPVIYLNVTSAEVDPAIGVKSPKHWLGDILQHEVAHFLGFQHSRSSLSILSATGNSHSWDMGGVDAKMFEDYLRRRK